MPSQSKQTLVATAADAYRLNVLGHVVNVKLGKTQTQGDVFMFEVVSPAGLAVPPHAHQNEDEYGYVTEGTYECVLDGRAFVAKAGDVVYCPRHTSHGFRNIGTTTAKMVWVSTPGAAVEAFFNDLGALPANEPPDMQRLLAIFAKYEIAVVAPQAA